MPIIAFFGVKRSLIFQNFPSRFEAVKLDELPIAIHFIVEESDPHQVGDPSEAGVLQTQNRTFPLPSNITQCWYYTVDAL